LWKTDGTEAGTSRVTTGVNPDSHFFAPYLTVVDGTIFLNANADMLGAELHKSDHHSWYGTLLFTALDDTGGRALWRSDGTSAGTRPLQRVAPPNRDYAPTSIALSGDSLFFTADDRATGQELWVIPTVAGVGAALTYPGHSAGRRQHRHPNRLLE
jgi:ELWxxDGT repeat protein